MAKRPRPLRARPTRSKTARAHDAEIDRSRSLTELEGDDWGSARPDDSGLVTRCLAARRVAIGALSLEQLRMLIGQRIGLRFLVAIAVEALERDPFACGDLYPGDLLSALSTLSRDQWAAMPAARERLRAVLDRAIEAVEGDDDVLRATIAGCARSFAASE